MAIDTRNDSRVDELRRQLRSLGYLEARVDRFVLAPVQGVRHPATIAVLASLRIGVLAALLLGPAAAIGVIGRLPGLISGPRDAFVVTLYLALAFGCGATAAAFVASLGVLWMARVGGSRIVRRARGLSLVAGALVTITCLVYLGLWSQAAGAETGWSVLWSVAALIVATAIGLLLGHAVAATALALIVAGGGTTSGASQILRSSWKVSFGARVAAFLVAATLLQLLLPLQTAKVGPSQLTIVPSGLRVRLIAIDGFDPDVLNLPVGRRLPALSEAFGGVRADVDDPEASDGGRDPAREWTTIATGQPAAVHGVQRLETRRVAGIRGSVAAGRSAEGRAISAITDLMWLTRPSLASGNERREKTFWEVASQAGLRTVVVNWWATWPAPVDRGIILSDRATLRLERGGPLDAEIAPPELYEKLRQRYPGIRERASAMASDALSSSHFKEDIASLLRRSAELDAIQVLLASEVSSPQTDLLVVYLPGLDIAQHTLLGNANGAALPPSDLTGRLDAVKEYYVALDRLLTPMLIADRDELVMIVTAPGRVGGTARGQLALRGRAANAERSAIRRAGDTGSTSIAPTVLYALGVPISKQLSGTPLVQLFATDFTKQYAVRYVAGYGQPAGRVARPDGQPLDQEMIDRLRSLGYLR